MGAVDRQDQAAIEHTRIEPVGQDELDTNGSATVVECLPPFVDPGETVASALVLLADRRGNGRRLQAVERCAQPLIMVLADRKSVVEGKSVSVRVDLGGRRIIKKKQSKSIKHK